MATPILTVLFTVFQSICQVFLICLAGYTLSYNRIVDKPTSKALNHINIALFTPALLFSKVAFFLTPDKLRQLWVIPIFFTVLTGLSGLIAHYLARACRLKRSQVNFATAASMFMNSNSLPVALMQSLASTVPLLKWGPDDTVNDMFSRSLTYLVVFSTLGMIVRWSYGVQLLTQTDEEEPHSPPAVYSDSDDPPEPPLSHITVETPTARLIDYENETDTDEGKPTSTSARPITTSSHPHPHAHIRARTLRDRLSAAAARRHPHTHLPAVPTSLGDESESDSDSDQSFSRSYDAGVQSPEEDSEGTLAVPSSSTLLVTPPTWQQQQAHPRAPVPYLPRQPSPKSWRQRLLAALSLLSPPLAASLAALLIALVPPFQRTLNSQVFIPLHGALDAAGGCSVPLTLIVLGGWFWEGGGKSSSPKEVVDDIGNANGNVVDASAETRRERKGKAVEKDNGHSNGHPQSVADGPNYGQSETDVDGDRGGLPRQVHARTLDAASPSRTPSNASLSSMLSAFGDVLMMRIHPASVRRKAKGRSGLGGVRQDEVDVEASQRLTTHVETEDENEQPRELSRTRSSSRSRTRTQSKSHTPSSSKSKSKSGSRSRPSLSPANTRRGEGKHDSGSTNPPGESLTIAITLVARMFIVPVVVTPAIVFFRQTGWGGDVFNDPVFLVSSMLLVASPPALTLAQISQRSQRPGVDQDAFSPFERLLSRTVFWAYCVLTPPLTILSVMIGLMIVGAA